MPQRVACEAGIIEPGSRPTAPQSRPRLVVVEAQPGDPAISRIKDPVRRTDCFGSPTACVGVGRNIIDLQRGPCLEQAQAHRAAPWR